MAALSPSDLQSNALKQDAPAHAAAITGYAEIGCSDSPTRTSDGADKQYNSMDRCISPPTRPKTGSPPRHLTSPITEGPPWSKCRGYGLGGCLERLAYGTRLFHLPAHLPFVPSGGRRLRGTLRASCMPSPPCPRDKGPRRIGRGAR